MKESSNTGLNVELNGSPIGEQLGALQASEGLSLSKRQQKDSYQGRHDSLNYAPDMGTSSTSLCDSKEPKSAPIGPVFAEMQLREGGKPLVQWPSQCLFHSVAKCAPIHAHEQALEKGHQGDPRTPTRAANERELKGIRSDESGSYGE